VHPPGRTGDRSLHRSASAPPGPCDEQHHLTLALGRPRVGGPSWGGDGGEEMDFGPEARTVRVMAFSTGSESLLDVTAVPRRSEGGGWEIRQVGLYYNSRS